MRRVAITFLIFTLGLLTIFGGGVASGTAKSKGPFVGASVRPKNLRAVPFPSAPPGSIPNFQPVGVPVPRRNIVASTRSAVYVTKRLAKALANPPHPCLDQIRVDRPPSASPSPVRAGSRTATVAMPTYSRRGPKNRSTELRPCRQHH